MKQLAEAKSYEKDGLYWTAVPLKIEGQKTTKIIVQLIPTKRWDKIKYYLGIDRPRPIKMRVMFDDVVTDLEVKSARGKEGRISRAFTDRLGVAPSFADPDAEKGSIIMVEIGVDSEWVWKIFTSGHKVFFMDPCYKIFGSNGQRPDESRKSQS